MSARQERYAGGIGPFGAIRERPMLFAVLAVLLFACALLAASVLMKPAVIEATIRTDLILVDDDAEDPASLIKPAALDSEGLRNALSAAMSSLAEDSSGSLGGTGWHERVGISEGNEDGAFILSFCGDRALRAARAVARMNDLVSRLVDHLNQRRGEQLEEILTWIDKKDAAWQAKIDETKAAIVDNPFDSDRSSTNGQSASETLLRLMVDATVEAEATRQTSGRNARQENGSDDYAPGQLSDVTRLKRALAELETGHAAQLRLGTALKEAEVALAKLREQSAALLAEGGILDRPAAVVLEPASIPIVRLLAASWQTLLPILAALSLALALLATTIACRLRPPVKIARDDYLNDPNWPLPPDAHRELSN